MTDEVDIPKKTNKNNEQELIESDVEQDDSVCTDDKSNVTTDDEFYDELMDAPSEYDDHLIPDGCKDEIVGIDHLTSCLNRRYNSCPVVFTGTLKDALKEAFNSKEIKERRPLLIYVNHDKSLYSNLFCKQLLCHEKIIEFLLNNYVLWAWDVTFQSNGEKLNEIYKTTFSQWNTEQHIGTYLSDQYPLLIGIRRDRNGDYLFTRLIDGSNKRPVIDEFLARLIQCKDQFDVNEEDFERAKEEAKQHMMSTLFRTHDFNQGSKSHRSQEYYRSTSMFPPMDYHRHPSQYSRLLSSDNNNPFPNIGLNLPHAFQRLHINPDDDDDDDDDDDENEQTPTVDRSLPKFSK